MAKKDNYNMIDMVESSYHSYMINSIGRKLPSFIDGQINVGRRIIWDAYKIIGAKGGKKAKLQEIIGSTLGMLHATGDASVAGAAKQLGKNFIHRYPLVDSHGTNYGSLSETEGAAPRYLAASTSEIAEDFLLSGTSEITSPFIDSYNGKTQEPIFLSAKIPYYLIQGSNDIMAGFKGQRVSHNIHDVSRSFIHYIKHKKSPMKKLVELLKGPDFANGGEVVHTIEELVDMYEEGKGTFIVRGTYEKEIDDDGNKVVITSVPQGDSIDSIFNGVDKLMNKQKAFGKLIKGLEDQSSGEDEFGRSQVRIVIYGKSKNSLDQIIDYLISGNVLQNKSNRMSMIGFDRNLKPRSFGLREIYQEFLEYRIEAFIKSFEDEKENLEINLEIQEGFQIVVNRIDEVIKVIRNSKGREEAKEKLMKKFKLTELQAEKIGGRNLFSLTKTDAIEIDEKIEEIENRIEEIEEILKEGEERVEELIIEEIEELLEKHEYVRYTEIINDIEDRDIKIEKKLDIQDRTIFVGISTSGLICSVDGVNISEGDDTEFEQLEEQLIFKDGSKLEHFVKTSNLSKFMIFTDMGGLYNITGHLVPQKNGIPIQTILKKFENDEKILLALEKYKGSSVVAISENGTSHIIEGIEEYDLRESSYRTYMNDDVSYVGEIYDDPETELVYGVTSEGRFHIIDIEQIPTKNGGKGVRIFKLNEGEEIIEAGQREEGDEPFKINGKKINFDKYDFTTKGGRGVKF